MLSRGHGFILQAVRGEQQRAAALAMTLADEVAAFEVAGQAEDGERR